MRRSEGFAAFSTQIFHFLLCVYSQTANASAVNHLLWFYLIIFPKSFESWEAVALTGNSFLIQSPSHQECFIHFFQVNVEVQSDLSEKGRRWRRLGSWHSKEPKIMGCWLGEKLDPEVLLLAWAYLYHRLIIWAQTPCLTAWTANTKSLSSNPFVHVCYQRLEGCF